MFPDILQKPPVEIIQQGAVWIVEEYRRGKRDGPVYSTHDAQIDAVRAAKSKMDADVHPCVVRWESPYSVRNVYWNPLFEDLEVRYDDLIEAWTVVPRQGTCAIAHGESREQVHERARRIQHDYNFKHLHSHGRGGHELDTRDHRFLRYDITQSGVRFDRSEVEAPPEPEPDEEEDDETEEETDLTYTQPASPARLDISIPDVTKVEFVDTDGVCHRYETPWGDGTRAGILVVSRKHATADGISGAFSTYFDPWSDSDRSPYVASVYESSRDPTPWVAYWAGEQSLADVGLDLPVADRLQLIEQLVEAVAAVTRRRNRVCGIRPENVRLRNDGGSWRVMVAGWGIEWAINAAVGTEHVTPFTAPEQLDGDLAPTTPVYQVGAVAHWLLCESPPVDGDPAEALRSGTHVSPRTVAGVSDGVEDALRTALALDPAQRYSTVGEFYAALDV